MGGHIFKANAPVESDNCNSDYKAEILPKYTLNLCKFVQIL